MFALEDPCSEITSPTGMHSRIRIVNLNYSRLNSISLNLNYLQFLNFLIKFVLTAVHFANLNLYYEFFVFDGNNQEDGGKYGNQLFLLGIQLPPFFSEIRGFIVKNWLYIYDSKYCPSLATTFSHLSGSVRIPRRKN